MNTLSYLTITYYDNYDFATVWGSGYNYVNDTLSHTVNGDTYEQPLSGGENRTVKDQVTGTKIKVLDGGVTGGTTYLKTVNYYDHRYRLLQVISDNYKGGEDRVSTLYDFSGRALIAKLTHIQRDVTWKELVGVQQTGNILKRVINNHAGAASVQQLAPGQNGYLEVIYSEGNTNRFVGLNDSNPDARYENINYSLRFWSPNTVTVFENTTGKATVSNVKNGDVFRIERIGGIVKFYHNGTEIALPSPVSNSTTALMVDTYFSDTNATLVGVKTSFGATETRIKRNFEYDHAGRLIKVYHQVNNGPSVLISQNEYNELGQLVDKKNHSVAGSSPKQSVDYRYNIRGWLTSINNGRLTSDGGSTNDDPYDFFGMNLNYDVVDADLGNAQLFNGNIGGVKWSHYAGAGTPKQKGYVYSYDPLNRILTSTYREKTTSWAALNNRRLAESGFVYDLNGNITKLVRNDRRTSGKMDSLTYSYGTSGNKLESVTDGGDAAMGFVDGNTSGADYTYDSNGNMLTDKNKGISTTPIAYNYLNLPEIVTRGTNSIQYIYDASGKKLAQVTSFRSLQKQTDYVGELQYENDLLQQANHEEGRVVFTKNEYVYYNHGESTTGVTGTSVNIITHTVSATGEKYLKASASAVASRGGFTSLGDPVVVTGGERYRIRVKGYRDKGTATSSNVAYLSLKIDDVDSGWPGSALPEGSVAESWTEQIVVIPAGKTILKIGINWSPTVAIGEAIYFNELEVIKESAQAPEYQYFLKDHLGNVRVTFTSKDEVESAIATMETANASAEQGKFIYYNEAIKVNHVNFDKTYDGTTGATYYATRLTGGTTNAKFGLAKSIAVMPGDVINARVYAKYVDTNQANWTPAFNTFMTSIAGANPPPGSIIDGGSAGSMGGGTLPFTPIDHSSEPGTAPKAYLNYFVFNSDMTAVLSWGYQRVTTNSREYGQNAPHDLLALNGIAITQPGFVYLYLSNENPTAVEVYFDDFFVEHEKSPVRQMDDYYAFGMTFNSYLRENSVPNRYQFNGKERQNELNVDWSDFGARMYLADIARWSVIDPLAGEMRRWSPYNFVFNNPLRFIDPDGMGPDNQVIDSKGKIVFDDKKDDGNVYQLKDDNAKVDPKNIGKNTVQLVKNNVFVGTDAQLKSYISNQAKQIGVNFGKIDVKQDAKMGSKFETNMGSVSMKGGKLTLQPLNPDNKGLSVNNKPGSKNLALGNVNNLRSTLEHENRHQTQVTAPKTFSSIKEMNNWKETDATTKQMSGEYFKSTTSEYKQMVNDYLKEHSD